MPLVKPGLWQVAKGDTLSGIASATGTSVEHLCAINAKDDPDWIYVGENIATNKGTSGESSSGSASKVTEAGKATITAFGEMSNKENELFATWSWTPSVAGATKAYAVEWTYTTGDKYKSGDTKNELIWFTGKSQEKSVDPNNKTLSCQDTYTIPDNAKKIRFRVKPIGETRQNSDVPVWEAKWTDPKPKKGIKCEYNVGTTVDTPSSAPSASISGKMLTAKVENVTIDATKIRFQVYKNDVEHVVTGDWLTLTATKSATWTCGVTLGATYKVRYQLSKDGTESEWSPFSSEAATAPNAPVGLKVCSATSETSVYFEWETVPTATSYEIEYTTDKRYFGGSNQTTVIDVGSGTQWEETGFESGDEYFFRIRAKKDSIESEWSTIISSIVLGSKPAPPTTWSSTTTVIEGEDLTLYWVHNSEDGSKQTYAELAIYVDGVRVEPTTPIKHEANENDEEETTSYYVVDTSGYKEGATIEWKVRTAGVLITQYSDWSVQRTINVYAKPNLEMVVTNKEGEGFDILTSFPFNIYALGGPNTQVPTGYQISITSDQKYETTDAAGNPKVVTAGEVVFSEHYDTTEALRVKMEPSMVDLMNGMNYTIACTVSMNSGLTATSSFPFHVSWSEVSFQPDARITIDVESLTAVVQPYCTDTKEIVYKVNHSNGEYVVTDESLEFYYGKVIYGARTNTGDLVYEGVDGDGNNVLYSPVLVRSTVENTTLAVYRREYDGRFVELATGLPNEDEVNVTDPHPALDYARYRIIATNTVTGAVGYYDPPATPVGGDAVVIQWNEAWQVFEKSADDPLEMPPWSGSMVRIPYDIDISDKYDMDVSTVEYIGRKHPVSYYGTQLGVTSSWKVNIPKTDIDTLYALRRLAIWQGDVYVREPSGTGYWARIKPSWSINHCELTIPVTFDVTRVEGGI